MALAKGRNENRIRLLNISVSSILCKVREGACTGTVPAKRENLVHSQNELIPSADQARASRGVVVLKNRSKIRWDMRPECPATANFC